MDEQKQQEDRWRELADLLGLPGDGPDAPKQAPPAPEPKAPAIRAYEEPFAVTPRFVQEEEAPPVIPLPTEVPSIPMVREEPMADWETEFEEEDEDELPADESDELTAQTEDLESESGEEEPADGEPAPGTIAGSEEEKPRRGRRRRRRGRRRSGDRPEEGQEARPAGNETAPKVEARPERPPAPRPARHAEPDPRDRQGRSRQKPRDDDAARRRPAVAERAQVEPEERETERTPARRPSAVDDTDFSDWTVPSWQDLISALYRPDR